MFQLLDTIISRSSVPVSSADVQTFAGKWWEQLSLHSAMCGFSSEQPFACAMSLPIFWTFHQSIFLPQAPTAATPLPCLEELLPSAAVSIVAHAAMGPFFHGELSFCLVLRHYKIGSRKWDSSPFPTNWESGSQADLLQQCVWNGNTGVELFGLVTSCCLLE